MHTDVDLPAPGFVWARWAALAATLAGIGVTDEWFVDDSGAHHADQRGSWARFALLDGGRAVLYGRNCEHSCTAAADPPIDLLTGAPDWLPWAELCPPAEADELGFVAWHNQGRWSRVHYRDDVGDGLTHTVSALLSAGNAVAELADVVARGRPGLPSRSERAEIRVAGEQLLAAAVRGEVEAATIERLLGRRTEAALNVTAALFAAGRGGITAGTRPPQIPPGVRPAMRRVRRLSRDKHDRLVWAAMHDAAELPRPAPPETAELESLISWLRSRATGEHGRCTLLAYADSTSLTIQPGDHPPSGVSRDQRRQVPAVLAELIRAARRAESDPAHGRWLFLRVTTLAGGVHVERRYDSWPYWWADDGVNGPWRTNLSEELTARKPLWRPSWVSLLNPEVAFRPAN